MRKQNKYRLLMTGLTGIAGLALVTTGTFSLFSASGQSTSDTFAAGTVQIKVWDGDDCVGPDWTTPPQNLSVAHLLPGADRSKTFTVQNTGSLDEWIGVLAHVPTNIPVQVEYTVDVYPPDPTDVEVVDHDENGDHHSHCHTGSKELGAGGEDKSGGDQTQTDTPWQTYSVGWFSLSDTTPQLPFELPVGYHAHITYTYKLDKGVSPKVQDQSGPLSFDVWAVQHRNNMNESHNGPVSWEPQPAN